MRVRRGSWCWLVAGCGALFALLAGQSAQALTISLLTVSPTPPTVYPGNAVFVEVQVSGLAGELTPTNTVPAMTGFDLELSFDATRLDFVGLTFNTPLGMDTCTPTTWTAECDAYAEFTTSTGLVSFAATSLYDLATTIANQPASGTLATIQFLATGPGTASFSFTGVDLSGTKNGITEVPLSATTSGLNVVVAVPEPGTACLILLGLFALRCLPKPARA